MQSDERPMIPFQGSYTKKIVRRATRAMMARFRALPWLLSFALVVSFFGVVVPIQHGEPVQEVILAALPGLLFMSALLAFFLWIPRSSADRQLATNKLLQEPKGQEERIYRSMATRRPSPTASKVVDVSRPERERKEALSIVKS